MFENGFHPIDALRERVSNFRAHPFQNIASMVAGGLGGPLGGAASRGIFNRYNQNQFDNAANTNQERVTDQMGMDTNDAMNKPLNGPLGQFEGSDNSQLANIMAGAGSGGGHFGNPGGYNMSQQWQNPSGFTGGSSVVQGILDQLPGGSNFTPLSHQEHLQNIENQQNMGGGMPGANYGVSNFMAGGSPVITGYMPDMNQKYLKGKY